MPSVDPSYPLGASVPETGLWYLEAGMGPAVVLLHGWGAFKEIWWSTLRALSPHFRVVAFDWPGHGQSPVGDRFDLDHLAELAAASCVALGLDPIALVGHSMGGNVAARLALAQPTLVKRLALIDAALNSQYLAPRSRWYAHPRFGERGLHLGRRIMHPVARWGKNVPHDHPGGLVRPFARRMHYMVQIEPRVLHGYLQALWQASLGERIRQITQPTLVLTGARDPLVSPQQAEEAVKLIPMARLHVLPGALHNPMDEQPAAFHAALLEFLLEG